jgi:hypothetical protein
MFVKDSGRTIGEKVREVMKRPDMPFHIKVERTVEAFNKGKFEKSFQEMSLAGFAEGLLGSNWQMYLLQFSHGANSGMMDKNGQTYWGRAQESVVGIDPSAFTNITGQLLVREVKRGYEDPSFIGDKLVRTIQEPSVAAILGELKVPGVSKAINLPTKVGPGTAYPQTKIVEDWINLPAIAKYGQILAITIEALVQDRTGGDLQNQAMTIGYQQALRKELEILNAVMGLTNTYNWKGTNYNTYLTTGNWVNKRTGVSVTPGSWNSNNIFKQQMLFSKIRDPYTNNVINIPLSEMRLLYPQQSDWAFRSALDVTSVSTGQTATSPSIRSEGRNPLQEIPPAYTSPYIWQILTDAGYTESQIESMWWLGIFNRAFGYREWFPISYSYAPAGAEAEFRQDIVYQVKCHEAGVAAVLEPRYTSQSIDT